MVALGRWLLDKIVYEVYIIEVVLKYVYILRVFCVFARPNQMAYNFAHSIFWKLGSFFASCVLFIRLYTPKSATLLLFFPSKGMKELLVSIFCNGSILEVLFMEIKLLGKRCCVVAGDVGVEGEFHVWGICPFI